MAMAQNPNQRVVATAPPKVYPAAEEDMERGNAKAQLPTAPLIPHKTAQNSLSGGVPEPARFPLRQYPRSHLPPPRKRRGCCCRCMACTCCVLLVLILALAVAIAALYLVLRPKLPKYSVDDFSVRSFGLNASAMTLSAQFSVQVTARNPNKKIGIYYEKGSSLSVAYEGVRLCRGAFPAFYQGHRNTTKLQVLLSADAPVQLSSQIVSLLNSQSTQGKVPLSLRADVPVKIKAGSIKSFKVTIKVRCDLVVKGLQAGQDVTIATNKCRAKL